MHRSKFVVALLGMGVWTGSAAAQQNPGYFYVFEGQHVPLGLDASRVAQFAGLGEGGGEGDRAAPLALDAQANFTLGEQSAHTVNGWSYLEIGPGADRGATPSMENVIADLASANPTQFFSPVFENEQGPLLITQDLLIGFHDDILRVEAEALIAELGLGEVLDVDFHGNPGVYRVRSGSNDGFVVLSQANLATGFPEVMFAEPDMIMTVHKHGAGPNDPLFDQLWGIHNTGQSTGWLNDFDMDGLEAWDITTGSPAIVAVVLDDGADTSHPDLNIVSGFDFAGVTPDGGHDPNNPCDFHGTWVAGCIAGRVDNNIGGAGIAPTCRVAPMRVLVSNEPCNGTGSGQISWFTGALQWAVDNGARVTNASLGLGFSSSLQTAYANTATMGLVHFASSGNDGASSVGFPASAPAVIAVGAATPGGARASFSNTGPNLELMGPGTSVVTTARGGGFSTVQGTSFSSPYAAGVGALVLSRNSLLTSQQVRDILNDSAVDMGVPGPDTSTGNGMVNAKDALDMTMLPGPPEAFGLLTPSDLATNVELRPSFEWEISNNATSFLIEVDDDPAFGSPEISVLTSDTSYDHLAPALPVSTVFHWRVTASNALDSVLSGSRSFTTLMDPPAAFSLSSPSHQAIDVSQTPTLSWQSSDLAVDYVVVLSPNMDLSDPIINQTILGTSLIVGSALEPSQTHYWSVEARNEVGSTFSTPDPAQFTTIAAPPGAFNLVSPGAAATVTTRTPTFEWTSSIGADTYTLTVDNDADFGSPVLAESGIVATSFQVAAGTLINQTNYSWKVEASNPDGTTLATFAPRTFFTFFPVCFGDADFNGVVNFTDITSVLGDWGADYGGGTGPGDADGNGTVNFTDITTILGNWLAVCQ